MAEGRIGLPGRSEARHKAVGDDEDTTTRYLVARATARPPEFFYADEEPEEIELTVAVPRRKNLALRPVRLVAC